LIHSSSSFLYHSPYPSDHIPILIRF
jgi:hypothetical protein